MALPVITVCQYLNAFPDPCDEPCQGYLFYLSALSKGHFQSLKCEGFETIFFLFTRNTLFLEPLLLRA